MAEGTILLNMKERKRMVVLEKVKVKGIKLKEASEIIGLSYRQTKRIWSRYKKYGAYGLPHALRGTVGNRRKDKALKENVVTLYREKYKDFGPTLASEKLEELDGLEVNRETLRRWLRDACLWAGRSKHRAHRRRRARRAHFGELVQLDGSDHKWFEKRRADRTCLMVMVDDATGHTEAIMSEKETTKSALAILRKWVERHGVPSALYTDKKNIYVSDREPTPEEKRQGSPHLTKFGQVCQRLGIEIIPANSPQAKGRVERKNGVFQDRFVKELRLQDITMISGANGIIGEFTDDINQRFAIKPSHPANYHCKLPPNIDLDEIFSIESKRAVQNDWTLSYDGKTYQILNPKANSSPRKKVTVSERPDGRIFCRDGEHNLALLEVGVLNGRYKR